VTVCDEVYDELHGDASRLVQTLRWLFNRRWPARPLRRARPLWSVNGRPGARLRSGPSNSRPSARAILELTEQGIELVERVWKGAELGEPLARQILLEAVSLAEENPRAAFIVAVAAAEIGVKQFAAGQSESLSEAWLLENLQSPPLDRLLREYLVRLTDKKTTDGRAVPPELTSLFEKAIKTRNRLVHRGEAPPSEEEVAALLVRVNDLLYLLDWFAGHTWAFRHVQEKTQSAYPESE
jgi:hypothetical protein